MKTISTFKVVLVISISFVFTSVGQPSLGTTAALEGPAAGSDSVVLAMGNPTDTWTATANAAWLHLSGANQSGTGSTNVVFSYDANPVGTRTGTLTVAGQTLTVTQAGSSYVAAPVPLTKVVSSGLLGPSGVALDTVGNVYIADSSHNAIKEWVVASNTVITLVRSGLRSPGAVAVDGAGNVYIADTYNNAIKEWVVAHNTVTTLVSSGLSYPWDVALDALRNVYIADDGNHAIEKWTAASNTVTTLIGSGLGQPLGVALDSAGNFYIADFASGTIQKWVVASQTLTTLVSGLYQPYKVAVDGAGNVYIAETGNNVIKKWTAASQTVTTLVASGLSNPMDVEVDGLGNVYIADKNNNAIKELPRAFVDPVAKAEGPSAGSDTLPAVLPATANLLAPFAPTNDQPWLTITGITNGVVSFTFGANTTATNRTAHLTLLGQPITITQGAATVPIISQPANLSICAGSPATFSVTASGDNPIYQWQVSQDGGNTFTNISDTATNASYTNLSSALADNGNQYQVIVSGWLGTATSAPPAVLTVNAPATASTGGNQTIRGTSCLSLNGAVGGCATGGVWTSSGSGTFLPNATTLNAMYCPSTVDLGSGTVLLTLTSTGPCAPCTSATAQMAVTLQAPPTISNGPSNLIVCAGSPAVFSVSAAGGGLSYQWKVSQDGGNTFTNISDTATNASYTNLDATLADNGNQYQVIVTGTVFSATSAPPAVLMVSAPAIASAGPNQTIVAGSATAGLGGMLGGSATGGTWSSSGTGNFAPNATTLDASYTPSAGDIKAGTVTLRLSSTGQLSPCGPATAHVVVTIFAAAAQGTSALLEGPGAGSDSVVLAVGAPTIPWTATANAPWLHLSASGAGSMNVVFSYDANPGSTRTGTLTIAGLPLTVTQAGSTYVAAPGPVTTLVAAGLIGPQGVAVDGVGNVYFADTDNNAIKEWLVASNTVTTLVASGLNQPTGVAVDGAGNVYFANDFGFIDEWSVANNTVSQVTGIGYYPRPLGVAVDDAGNVYFGLEWGTGLFSEIYGLGEWTAASQKNTIPLPGTYLEAPDNPPGGVAVDAAGNVYFTAAGALNEWNGWNATNTAYDAQFSSLFTPLVGRLNNPWGVAVDGGGNVYVADSGYPQAIVEWTAANNTVTTLVSSGVGSPSGIAVDRAGNVYFADWGRGTINELPHAFVDPTAKSEGPAAGSDGLPVVLPATANLLAPFAPTSDQPWLTITGATNGVVSFAFSANTGSTNRTANITVLGQPISVTQTAVTPPTLIGPMVLSNGRFQFAFSNNDLGASFTVLTTTNLSLPLSNWTLAGPAANTAPGLFQFSTSTTNNPQGFYRIRSP